MDYVVEGLSKTGVCIVLVSKEIVKGSVKCYEKCLEIFKKVSNMKDSGKNFTDMNEFMKLVGSDREGDGADMLTDEQVKRMVNKNMGATESGGGLMDDEDEGSDEFDDEEERKPSKQKKADKAKTEKGNSDPKKASKQEKKEEADMGPEPDLLGKEKKIVDGLV